LILSVFAVFGISLLRSIQTYFQVARRFAEFGLADLVQSGIKFLGVILVVILSPRTMMVVAIYVIAPVSVAVILLTGWAKPLLTSSFDWDTAGYLWKQIRLYAATAVVGSTVARMDVFVVAAVAGTAQAGIFSAANTFALVPQLIGMYMSVVLTPRIVPMWNDGTFRPTYKRSQVWLGVCCLALWMFAWIVFPSVAKVLLPRSFSASAPVFIVLLPAALCSLMNFPWTVPFLLFFRPRALLAIDLIGSLPLIVLYTAAARHLGAIGVAAVTTGFALLKTTIMQMLAVRLFKQNPTTEAFA
jgi:O-antigen/teichoic acid export membrane protein